jgi:hemolysin III
MANLEGVSTASIREQRVSHAYVTRAVYGLVTVLAVLQAMELHPPSAWAGVITLFGTTLAVALVETYAHSIATMLAEEHPLSLHELRDIWHDVAPVLTGAQGPTVPLLLAAFGVISVEYAIDLAQLIAFLLLFGYGWRIGTLLDNRRSRHLLSGVMLLAIGGIIVGIKAAFH